MARYLLGERELIWTFLYQEMPSNLVMRSDASWTGQRSVDEECFGLVIASSMLCVRNKTWLHSVHQSQSFTHRAREEHMVFIPRTYLEIWTLS